MVNPWLTPNTLFVTEGTGGPDSDIVTLTNQGGDAYIYFTSDDDSGNLGTIPIEASQQTLAEDAGGITARTTQTLTPTIPEPGSVVLLITMVSVLAVFTRRRFHGPDSLSPTKTTPTAG